MLRSKACASQTLRREQSRDRHPNAVAPRYLGDAFTRRGPGAQAVSCPAQLQAAWRRRPRRIRQRRSAHPRCQPQGHASRMAALAASSEIVTASLMGSPLKARSSCSVAHPSASVFNLNVREAYLPLRRTMARHKPDGNLPIGAMIVDKLSGLGRIMCNGAHGGYVAVRRDENRCKQICTRSRSSFLKIQKK